MHALGSPFISSATCGDMDEMRHVAAGVSELKGPALKRSEHALAHLAAPSPFDHEAAEARLVALLGATA